MSAQPLHVPGEVDTTLDNSVAFYVGYVELNKILVIRKSADLVAIPGTDMHLQFRPGESGRVDNGVTVYYADGIGKRQTEALSHGIWLKHPLGAEHFPLTGRVTLRVFTSKEDARHALTS